MRRTTAFGTIVVALTAGVSVAAGPAHAATTELFVNNTDGANCSDAGAGSAAQPFCTVSAAAAVVTAGQTVHITGTYREHVTIARSGTPGNPITFHGTGVLPGAGAFTLNGPDAGITIDGQHDVSINGAQVNGDVTGPGIAVTASTRIALERVAVSPNGKTAVPGVRLVGVTDSTLLRVSAGGSVSPAIGLDATTSRVTVTSSSVSAGTGHRGGIEVLGQRNSVLRTVVRGAAAAGITVGPGATDTVVASNSVFNNRGFGIVNDGATGTAIANNSVVDNCWTGIRVSGASAGVSVQNNDIRDNGYPSLPCVAGASDRFGIGVHDAAVSGTTVDYNTVPPRAGVAPYAWGTFTGELAEFRTVSGQGAHDLAQGGTLANIDSANSAAPGWQATDRYGRRAVDSPDRANTGAGPVPFADRGPIESVLGPTAKVGLTQRPGCQVTADASVSTPGWGAIVSYTFTFGDGATVTQASPVATHTYPVCGTYFVKVVATDANDMTNETGQYFRPADAYVPVGPVRILDTREAIGSPGRTPVAPGGTLTLPVTGHSGVPAVGVTSVTMNVTATEPTSDGFLTVYPSGQPKPTSSNLNWTRGLTVPNLVVMQVVDGKINFHNSGPGTVHLVADLVGYHTTGTGSSFVPLGPVRALDTREAIGTPGRTPVAPGGTLTLPVAGRTGVPATGVTAVTMNVTVTEPTSAGFLTVYPNGRALPNASNLNWTAGQTVPNLVVVPVIDGKVNLRNSGPGTVHVIADVVGYHTTDQGTLFQPRTPYRALDTRNGTGMPNGASYPVSGGSAVSLRLSELVAEGATSVVLNVTVTEPTSEGFLTVYGDFGQPLPNASNLNWRRGQTVPNLVVVPLNTANGIALLHHTGAGSVHVVADVVGFYRN
ncbi:right-handed parallel beta-helix repeat-containing protein [Longispora urticae]